MSPSAVTATVEDARAHPLGTQEGGRSRPAWLVVYLAIALTGFSANSLLTRFALDTGAIDPATFMVGRLVSGAAVLTALAGRAGAAAGSWSSALTLVVYAAAFTLAYVRIGAATGALLLFGSVQATMVGWAVVRGERPTARGWFGFALALAGLIGLTAPGLTAPDAIGALLMIVAGAAWGVYSLRGRGVASPLSATAGNFLRAVPFALVIVALDRHDAFVTARGLLLAIASGSLASGLAYAAWYAALTHLSAWRAAILQLSVPVMTAGAAALLLGEGLTVRLAAAGAAIICGVALSVPRPHRESGCRKK